MFGLRECGEAIDNVRWSDQCVVRAFTSASIWSPWVLTDTIVSMVLLTAEKLLFHAVAKRTHGVLRRSFPNEKNHCIDAVAVQEHILSLLGYESEPMPVKVYVLNAGKKEATKLLSTAPGWNGHIGTKVKGIFLDPTACQYLPDDLDIPLVTKAEPIERARLVVDGEPSAANDGWIPVLRNMKAQIQMFYASDTDNKGFRQNSAWPPDAKRNRLASLVIADLQDDIAQLFARLPQSVQEKIDWLPNVANEQCFGQHRHEGR